MLTLYVPVSRIRGRSLGTCERLSKGVAVQSWPLDARQSRSSKGHSCSEGSVRFMPLVCTKSFGSRSLSLDDSLWSKWSRFQTMPCLCTCKVTSADSARTNCSTSLRCQRRYKRRDDARRHRKHATLISAPVVQSRAGAYGSTRPEPRRASRQVRVKIRISLAGSLNTGTGTHAMMHAAMASIRGHSSSATLPIGRAVQRSRRQMPSPVLRSVCSAVEQRCTPSLSTVH
ncbi:uncharacterized protein CC84DRAFT_8600 [Paraphaeosphaeria sporulosa]|uniref:Uncharacterized protein n=1 Tax=Paraphaeosphaeria sporulosa TaxID=1460663 RepID=A0A177CWX8_9PLEO|nr:uncharacterized protein CC84DRAFT_8600 [Paraphaeosphaeria sporulosa]OAG11327.1 hypothetical protein CC84DRAFT_8600 [Paraphaeosphaeria sporulosa]